MSNFFAIFLAAIFAICFTGFVFIGGAYLMLHTNHLDWLVNIVDKIIL